jgi:hypothetical protein
LNVEYHRDQEAAGRECQTPAASRRPTDGSLQDGRESHQQTRSEVPERGEENEWTALEFIACMAEIPAAAGNQENPFMTKVENAKKTPAINPQASAVANRRAKGSRLGINLKFPGGLAGIDPSRDAPWKGRRVGSIFLIPTRFVPKTHEQRFERI